MRRLLLALFVVLAPSAVRADPVPAEGTPSETSPGGGASETAAATGDASDDDLESASTDADAAHTRGSTFRWSDGPRRVVEPHGRSMERAEELGLGTRECASRLLHGAPDDAWTTAARGRTPDRILWPVDDGGWVRGFGYVRTTRPDLIHRGVDIAAPEGTVVRAAADGIVAYADNGVHGYGNLVMIVHRNGWMTLYAHNSRITVQAGYRVTRGERIALVGSTGIAHGPHSHFELWQAGHAVDPAALFDGGPAFVERIAERAVARGDVPPIGEVTAEDRREEPPLPPHELDAERPTTTTTTTAPSTSERPIGSAELATWLRSHPAPVALLEGVEGRVFSTLLFPVRGGEITREHRSSRRPMEITGEPGTAIRAAADGVVVFAGTLPALGATVVLLHANGWVTLYERVDLGSAPAVGTAVERGGWIAHASDDPMRFELRVGGVVRDPADVLVDPRDAVTE